MVRLQAPLVGLATEVKPIATNNDADDAYDARIMHRAVSADLHLVTVLRDASDQQLATALSLTPAQVRGTILTSRTPVVDPRPPRVPATPHVCAPAAETRYRRPTMVPLSLLQRYRDMAVQLRTRLEALVEEPVTRSTTQYYAPPKPEALSIELSTGSNDSSSVVGSFEPTSIIPGNSACCGLGKRGRFVRAEGRNMVVRGAGGLYSGARCERALRRGECVYVEAYVAYAGGKGGLAIGVANQLYNIDKMVGALAGSMAVHSDAKVVRSGKWSELPHAVPFGTGDTVGLFVSVSKAGRVVMRVHVNGEFVGEVVGDDTLTKMVADGQGVNVMVSMLRPGARIALRCCPAEWRYSPFTGRAAVAPVCSEPLPLKNRTYDRTSAVLTP